MDNIFPGIVVDHFYCKNEHVQAFFLTHWHKDHIKGLTFSWKKGTIYCSEVTKNIIDKARPTIDPDKVVAMKPYETITVCGTQVTMMDANHMAGSAMFFFDNHVRSVMYTGDYRYHHTMILPNRADIVFIDGTFNRKPIRMLTMPQSCQLLHSWLTNNDHDPSNPLYVGYFHFGTLTLLYGTYMEYGCKFRLEQKRMTEEDYNICLIMYPDMWDQNSRNIVTPVYARNKEPLPDPIIMASTGWSMMEENHDHMGTITKDRRGHYRMNFSNHSDIYENEEMLLRMPHQEVHYIE